MNNKILEFSNLIKLTNPDIIVINETWLTNETPSAVLRLDNYTIFRRDRPLRGGGVLIGTKSQLDVSPVQNINELEILAIDIHTNSSICRKITFYNHNTNDVSELKRIITTIEKLLLKCTHYIIFSDLNLPTFSWSNSLENKSDANATFQQFLDIQYPIYQLVEFNTRGSSLLDVILTNDYKSVSDIKSLPPVGNSDHVVIMGSISRSYTRIYQKNYIRNFKKGDYVNINKFLSRAVLILDFSLPIQKSWSIFAKLIQESIHKYIPLSKTVSKENFKIPDKVINTYKKQCRSYRNWKITGRHYYYLKYNKLKIIYKTLITCQSKKAEQSLLNGHHCRKFFSFIKSKTLEHSKITISADNGSSISDSKIIGDMFNKYFCSVFGADKQAIDTIPKLENDRLIISESQVLTAAKCAKGSKGTGVDGIPMFFWTEIMQTVIKSLSLLFNQMANEPYIPDEWKTSIIRPLYKRTGSPSDVKSYRPIANTATLSRIFERTIIPILQLAVEHKLSKHQFGFTKGKSTLSNLLSFYSDIYYKLNKKSKVDIITIDFAKAFDKVDYNILHSKLYELGICSTLRRLLMEMITNRSQLVTIDTIFSTIQPINSGVPQGASLSPLLFKIYIDSLLSSKFNSQVKAFADDLKVSGVEQTLLQADISTIEKWSKTNKLPINGNKCECLCLGQQRESTYLLNGVQIPSVEFIKDLGILVDKDLKFTYHALALRSKCLRLIGLVFKIFHSQKQQLYLNYFKLYVLPCVDYCSFLFTGISPSVDSKLESIQRQFTKRLYLRLYGTSKIPDYDTRLKLFSLESLRIRYIKLNLVTVYKLKNGALKEDFLNLEHLTHHPNRFRLPAITSTKFRSSFIIRQSLLWNKYIRDHDPKSLPSFLQFINSLSFD